MKKLIILALIIATASAKFPDFVKLCKRSEDINPCIKQNILDARPFLKTGVRPLLLPPTDPFTIDFLEVNSTDLQAIAKDLLIYGFHDYEINDVNLDLEKNTFKIDLVFKLLQGYWEYKLHGSILNIDVNGQGQAIGNSTNLALVISLDGKRVQKDGKDYIDFSKEDPKHKFNLKGDVAVYFSILFRNPDLTRAVNGILNDAANDLITELQPSIEKIMNLFIANSIVKVFEKFSIDELFPL